jgi:UDP-N-acetylglucosamine--N-acetylmuramyl-(pentapeptide) pyrophosphoryl-undecaprenol N-acetylglucosamine transferase
MQQAHLVICRSGASTLAELAALGRVGILVPYPYAVNQHQEKNALYLKKAGAAFLILNQELTGEKIAAMIDKLLGAPQELQCMEERSHALGRPQAAAIIAAACQKYLN